MSRYKVGIVFLAILAVIAIVIASFIFYAYGSIHPEIPLPTTQEKLRFIRYLSCVMAMCSGHHVNGDICKSAEVIDAGWLEYEGRAPIKSCNDLCEEIKNRPGVEEKERYCDDEYKVRFVFQDDVNLTRKEDIRNYGNWKSLIHWCCDRKYMGELHGYSDCEMCVRAKECGQIWIDDDFAGSNCKIHRTHPADAGGVWKEYSWCFFENNTQVDIWAKARRDAYSWWFFDWEICGWSWDAYYHKCPELMVCEV